ncbi:TetR/AcrR family transcriptional regulator [Fodinibius sediminis]|uniref:Transcriptional regulator, TetR family n=1 Tax=Fodinibius sediminis TaxID=1214077 RepID=A0A521BXB8_9BACT|nr:TetR/AcrR family transcriptional regulator [Fodinibius sediminis]SMO51842.1 transcriptional regulator, TetR family [Fodinibius sediminis]
MSPRTPEQNKKIREQTQQKIVDAGFTLFAREGYASTSIAAIARKAGVSKGLIYHYFDSKEAILSTIFDQMIDLGDEILDFPDDFTPADKMRQTLQETFQFIEQQTGKGRLMITLALQPETYSNLQSKIERVNETQTVKYIEMLRELGHQQPELEAYRLGALMDGILMGYATMGEAYPLEKMKKKIMEDYVPS